jgi:predicted DNA-binding protein
MKTAVMTVRLPAATRRRLEELARREGRSLSQQIERLIDRGMQGSEALYGAAPVRGIRSTAGVLRVGRVPSLADFRKVRGELSASLEKRSRKDTL